MLNLPEEEEEEERGSTTLFLSGQDPLCFNPLMGQGWRSGWTKATRLILCWNRAKYQDFCFHLYVLVCVACINPVGDGEGR